MVVGCQPYAPAAFTPRKCSWYSFLLEAEIDARAIVRSEGFNSMKNPLTQAGIEPATFRIVAQHLNHCATAIPNMFAYGLYIYVTTARESAKKRIYFS